MSQKKAVVLRKKVQAELAEALMYKLSTAERDPVVVLESLTPDVRKRVEKLREIQKKHDDLAEKLLKEKEELEAKYEKLYQPLYEERSDIVNGVVEIKGVRASEEEGVPEFWLTVLKANAMLAHQIKWYSGKDLTKKISERNSKKGGKNEKPNKNCDSFFNFFDTEGLEYIEEIDEEEAEEIQIMIQQHYEIGCMIRDDIIPHAVSWFTGEATKDDEDEATDEDEDDEY